MNAMGDDVNPLPMIVQTFPIGRVISKDNARRVIGSALFEPRNVMVEKHTGKRSILRSASDNHDARKRAKTIDETLQTLVTQGALQLVNGGYLRGVDGQDRSLRVGFRTTKGFDYDVPLSEYETKKAQLRAMSPEAARQSEIEMLKTRLNQLEEGK